ncbi:hypothetical protein [Paenarthrobacter nitroguajacolicus]|uniref:hypothetical protein n=1 Tax=Paenarthrobacter nitroguajacolicus TaxID=211146 RepID=UPI00248C58F5|nr:hypothetical protein [Paenarthrobacter nitroguajacolicus]MDI2037155.1 hypothetical protein [Paenarthrobacter nitroguajacolicus]
MNQPLFIVATLVASFVICLAAISVIVGLIEVLFYKQRVVGLTENQRKQYITNVIKVILTTGAASLAAIVLVFPGFAQQNTPGVPNYTPPLTLLVVIVAALVTYRLELASESPDTLYDLYSGLHKSWAEQEDLKQFALARRKAWLDDFIKTDGGRAMLSSKKTLNETYQAAIDKALDSKPGVACHEWPHIKYIDTRFRRLARLTNVKMIFMMIRGYTWRSVWLLTPLLAVLLSWVAVALLWTPGAELDAPRIVLVSLTIAIGAGLSYFNFWARSTTRLKKYCELKRHERLCAALLRNLTRTSAPQKAVPAENQPELATSQQVAELAAAIEAHFQTNSPGIIRRTFRKIW